MIEFKLEYGTMCRSCGRDIAQGDPAYAKFYADIEDGNVFCSLCMDDPSIIIQKVVKIDPEGRFIFFFPPNTPIDSVKGIGNKIREWWDTDERFLFVSGNMTFMRLSNDGEAEVIFESEG